ncbi:MAG: SPOR domain-containing protein [Ideonella sp. WA131b]|jgi:cell division protein FtsN|nr:SPOR domain-containing protein [Ideonella sp. WA131b]
MNQKGGFTLGLVVGLLIGLVLALAVALYITKAPMPFIDKVPQRTAEQDQTEAARNRGWDPNAALGGAAAQRAASAATASRAASSVPAGAASAVGAAPAAPVPPVRDPAAILAGQSPAAAPKTALSPASAAAAAEPFVFFVQAGAYTRADDAEQQKAHLGLGGWTARVSEREQAGRTVWRVRIGPFGTRAEADTEQQKLVDAGIEAQIVRVEKP